jgi:hypothetical protein
MKLKPRQTPRYGTTYRPSTYAPTIPAQATDKRTGVKWDIKTKRIEEERTTTATFKRFQFPVQTLPKFNGNSGDYFIAFLFPSSFDSFFLLENKEVLENSTPNDRLLIQNHHQPIPILLSGDALENFSESHVTITGIVSLLPDTLLSSFSKNICDTRKRFFYNFFRPYSTKLGFCIDCRDPINSDFKQIKKLDSLPGALYVEGHFEGALDDKYKVEYKESIPKGVFWTFAYKQFPGISFYLSEHESVSVMGYDPSMFGFYIESDLVDQRILDIKIRELEEFYTSFRKKASNLIRKKYGIELRFKPDFIFDYKKQFIFHPEGVLASKEIDSVLENNSSIREIVTWLKK